jgi:prepilin-type N-terminal cleavage/methylation domain-containing protein
MKRLRRGRGDSGVTLIELLVVMLILSLVLVIAYSVLLVIQKQTKDTMARSDAVGESRLGLAHMDRQIRSGNVLYDPANDVVLGYPMSMRVFTQSNADEKCVQWQVYGGNLRMRSWSPNWRVDSKVSNWATIAHHVVNNSADPADTPFKLVGAPTPYSARVVDVLLRVKSPDAGGMPVDVKTSLTGRNTVYGYDQNVCSDIP